MKYDHHKIEPKWQKVWQKAKLYSTRDEVKGKENFYALVEFPYPSGNLHVGHWYAFSVPDIFARMLRMQGKNVLFPIGFDAFGLPAENAAISRKINPRKWTLGNIDYMKKQIGTMGASFDHSREVITCLPEYYRWNQWIFLQFFKKGLAYQGDSLVNWCPSCKTVLANEQVINGHCERCDSVVEQRKMKQWQLRITDYAEKLLNGLDGLDWPEEIKEAQRNWIGKSEGAEIIFPIATPAYSSVTPASPSVTPAQAGVQRFVLLHGYHGRPGSNFRPWLKKELEKHGHRVEIPVLPNPDHPSVAEQVEFVLKNIKLDEGTVLLGHSLGGTVALKVLEKFNGRIGGLVLIGTPINTDFRDKKPRDIRFDWRFDYGKIREKFGFLKILSDVNDHAVPLEHGRTLQKELGGELIEVESKETHFKAAEEPIILENLLNWIPAFAGMTSVKVFTTRPDTIFGATYMVVAPEHVLVQNYKSQITNYKQVQEYIEKAKRKTELQRTALEKDKTGVELKGVKAINPATGEEIPVWIADYVLMGYGTGAIMAVPAHDERDFVFAKKYGLTIRRVIYDRPFNSPPHEEGKGEAASAYTGEGVLINSGKFNGMDSEKAKAAITKFVDGRPKTQYKLRDWIISRQRYWGTPIPVIYCANCGAQPVPEKDLPVELPDVKDYLPRDDGRSPLAKVKKFVNVKCPNCGGPAERETDTMDTFVDSSWYFLRYTDPQNKKKFADLAKMKKWLPVDRYSGGAEHTTMHLLYSRFWIKAMHDLGLVPWDEPYKVRMNRGLILGPDGQKMSKSRGNVVDPDKIVAELGADTVRMYLAFIGPYNEVGAYPWDPKGILGIRRFLERVWRLGVVLEERSDDRISRDSIGPSGLQNDNNTLLHKTIKKVTEDIEAFKFNTAISAMMVLLNEMEKEGTTHTAFEVFLKLLAPFAPHLCEELWHQLGHKKSIHLEPWPQYDPNLIKDELIKVAVQVNGKLRATIDLAVDASQDDAAAAAQKDANVAKYLGGKKIRKVIYVKGKIVNFVI